MREGYRLSLQELQALLKVAEEKHNSFNIQIFTELIKDRINEENKE